MSHEGPPLIELRHISKKFGNKELFVDLNLTVESGCHLFIKGKSGRGKTTLIRIMSLLEEPNEGSILYKGVDVTTLMNRPDLAQRQSGLRLGFVSQDKDLWPHMTGRENIALALEAQGASEFAVEKKVETVARALGISEELDRRPHQVSGGQRQRLAIARMLVHEPDVLFLDESFANLDKETVKEVVQAIEHVTDVGTTLVIISHAQEQVASIELVVLDLDE